MNIGDIVNGLAAGVGIDLSPDGKTAYYVEWSVGELCKTEVDTGKVTRVWDGLNLPEDVLVDWDTGDIFVSERTGEITQVFEGEGERIVATPGGAPQQLALVKESGTRYLYTVCFDSGMLKCINVDAGSVTNVIANLGHPIGLAVDTNTNTAYVTEQDGRCLSQIDLSSGARAVIHSGLTSPFFLAWNRDGDCLYCVQRDPANSLIRIHLGSPVSLPPTVDTVATGLAWRPSGVAPNADDTKIYICADQKIQLISFNGIPTIRPDPPPFEVETIQFNYDGSDAIPLKDHVTDDYIHTQPEWISGSRDEPAAYQCGTLPHIKVTFRKGSGYAPGATYSVGAIGNLGGINKKDVMLTFSSSDLSNTIDFELMWPLPNSISKRTVTFEWYACETSAPTVPIHFSDTQHIICTTWKKPVTNTSEGLSNWVYKDPMLWTSEWATGKHNEKEICDAIVHRLPDSGLKYGIKGYSVKEILTNGGGMCSGWYRMFQHLAHCQGVFVHRRCYLVDWRSMPDNEEKWHAIVIKAGGLNQPYPTHSAGTFYDVDSYYPITPATPVNTVTEKRYVFSGIAGVPDDGHCINFLVYQNKLYLYDPSFGTGPFEIAPFIGADAPLPPKDYTIVGGLQLSSFKQNYLNAAVDYIKGNLRDPSDVLRNLTVKTSIIPDVIDTTPDITFYWAH